MAADTKKYWKEIVEPDDIDAHMVEVGQAAVNAKTVKQMMSKYPLNENATLYVPGCGTAQMFDFLQPSDLGNFKYLFADIKPEFLEKLKTRLSPKMNYEIIVDDVECSTITKKVDAALIVLLLQHIDWKLGLKNILATQPQRLFLIIQEQDATDSSINKNRVLRPTMQKFAQLAKTELVDKLELEKFLNQNSYFKQTMVVEHVPYTKRMLGFVFEKIGTGFL